VSPPSLPLLRFYFVLRRRIELDAGTADDREEREREIEGGRRRRREV
jgi:hypothetical protein